MPIKNFGEKGGWAYPGTAKMFWVTTIISELQILYAHLLAQSEQTPVTNLG